LIKPVLLQLLPLIELPEHGYQLFRLHGISPTLQQLLARDNNRLTRIRPSVTPTNDTQDFLAEWIRKQFILLESLKAEGKNILAAHFPRPVGMSLAADKRFRPRHHSDTCRSLQQTTATTASDNDKQLPLSLKFVADAI
jgi:hypothetical protein